MEQSESLQAVGFAVERIDVHPTHTYNGYRLRPGKPFPFGATFVPGGVNFSVFSRHATSCTLVLFEKDASQPLVEIPFPDEFRIGNVFVMAGVPRIMQAMFDGIRHSLAGGATMLSRAVTAEIPEGKIAAELGALQERYRELDIGSYPFFRHGKVGTSIVLRGIKADRLDAATDELKAIMRDLGGVPVEESPAGHASAGE